MHPSGNNFLLELIKTVTKPKQKICTCSQDTVIYMFKYHSYVGNSLPEREVELMSTGALSRAIY